MNIRVEEVLHAEGINKAYVDGQGTRQVLNDVSLTVRRGETIALMGPSGSGKSTLLAIIGGLLRPDSGSVVVCGEPLNYSKPNALARIRRECIGWISQSYDLIPSDSVGQNVGLPLLFDKPRLGKRDRAQAVVEALELAGLDVAPKRLVSKLSGGERQRVAIARSLVRTPKVLIADEPTAALDEETSAQIVKLFRDIAKSGVPVLIATHDPHVVAACDRIYRFNGPNLAQTDSAQ